MRGFTLIEMIVVIVVLGVLGLGFASLFTQSTQQYLEATVRQQFSSSTRLALERMSRELRDALPNSVRVDSNGNCVEFIPIIRGGVYLDAPFVTADNQFEALTLGTVSGVAYVSIMPLDASDVYGSAPATLAEFAGTVAANANTIYVQLTANKLFPRTSPSQRFFLTSTPVSFCVQGNGQLQRFSQYGNLANQSSSLTGGAPLADHLVQGSASEPVFRYSAGTLTRNALLQIHLVLRGQNETVQFEHEVMLRNVP